MRSRFVLLYGACLVSFGGVLAKAQGTFQNLDFENASFVLIPGEFLYEFAPALPGWTGYIGGDMQTVIQPNGIFYPPFITIMTPSLWNSAQGKYELAFASVMDGSETAISVELAQTGLVPAAAKSMHFIAHRAPIVLLGGQKVPVVPLVSLSSTRTLYGADVSEFSDQIVEFRFQADLTLNYFDDIQFSGQPIPEPSVLGLFILGALILSRRLRKASRDK